MSKPVVAIVGRPNVGKSTLFNVLAGERISIVQDTPGVTRDRIYAEVQWLDKAFTLIDTGGIEPDSKDIILSQMREQAEIAIATADVILFMTDVHQGLVDADAKVADMLRRSHKPVVLVPSPNVAEDHQTKNALALVDKQAAIYVKDSEAEAKLMDVALSTVADDRKLKELSENIAKLALPDSARIIAQEVIKLAEAEN